MSDSGMEIFDSGTKARDSERLRPPYNLFRREEEGIISLSREEGERGMWRWRERNRRVENRRVKNRRVENRRVDLIINKSILTKGLWVVVYSSRICSACLGQS